MSDLQICQHCDTPVESEYDVCCDGREVELLTQELQKSAKANSWRLTKLELELQQEREKTDLYESLLREALGDYGHPMFTDRYGMAARIKGALSDD